ncbi:MAG TPA: ParB/Srx family N-terminal domain-containing protein [Candidatus Angelobacter sp.]
MNKHSRPPLEIVYRHVTDLVANPQNARTHSPKQIRQLEASIQEFGFVNPVIIDRKNKIMAGHGRLLAAKKIGIEKVPTIVLEDLTEDQIRAYILADNRLAEKAGWDKSILAIELQHLISIDEIDVTITGFEIPEIDLILEEGRAEQDKDDVIETDETAPAVTQPNDLWKLGKHRILCGNALHESSFAELMGNRRANIVFADVPYNVAIDQNVCGRAHIATM